MTVLENNIDSLNLCASVLNKVYEDADAEQRLLICRKMHMVNTELIRISEEYMEQCGN